MKKLLVLIVFFVSIAIYSIAPIVYDRGFCSICLLAFMVVAIIVINEDIKQIGIINFNILFLFSFFVCSYVFPVFLLGRNSIIGALIENDLTTFDTVNRCVALCTLAISSYGISYVFSRKNNGIDVTNEEYIKASIITYNSRGLMVIVCIALLFVLYNYLRAPHGVSGEVEDSPYLFQLFYIVLPLYLVCSSIYYKKKAGDVNPMKALLKDNKVIMSLLIVLILIFIFIGDRAPLLTIALTLIITIAVFIIRIRPTQLILGGIIGILLMFALRVTRGGEFSLSEGGLDTFLKVTQSSIMENASPWDLLADLVGINMELNAGMDYIDRHGPLYTGANLLVAVSSPIPFLPTLLTSSIYGKLPVEVNSGAIIGDYTNSAAGNHCVIDLYMPFGAIGVMLAFFIFGWAVAKLSNGLNNSIFCKVFYVYLMSVAIFVARNSLTNIYRAFVLSYIVFYILSRINRKRVTHVSRPDLLQYNE